ncbi:MAG: hypothetical protein ACOY31_00550 [Bacillota bacterium]
MRRGALYVFFAAFLVLAVMVAVRPGEPAFRQSQPALGKGAGIELEPPDIPGRVVIVAMDYLQVKDLEDGLPPNLAGMFDRGAIALMNVNTGGGITPESTHATIGAGLHIDAGNCSSMVFSSGARLEKGTAAEGYLQRMGFVPPAGSIVNLDIARIYARNFKYKQQLVPGGLGRSLHEAGYKTAVLGNSDSIKGYRRPTVSMVMDQLGIVDCGSVDVGVVRRESGFIGGVATDYDGLIQLYKELPPEVRVVAIDLGDLARLRDAGEYMSGEQWNEWRSRSIERADRFMGSLLGQINPERDLVVLLSPTPGEDSEKKDRMSLIAVFGGGVERGLLYSPATRRAGVVMNVDIAPTILNYMGIPAYGRMTGRPMGIVPGAYGVNALVSMNGVLDNTYRVRPYLLKGYVIFQLILLCVSVGLIFMKKSAGGLLKPFFMFVISAPLGLLLLPLLPAGNPILTGVQFILLTAAVASSGLILPGRDGTAPFSVVSAATAAVILLDLGLGSPLQKASVLGYDPIAGARFYGLGNEYMGVFIGCMLIGSTGLIQSHASERRVLLTVSGGLYILSVFIIAAPRLGTNAGGTIAASAAFLVAYLMMCGVKISWPVAAAVAVASVSGVAFFAFYDFVRPVPLQSHLGRAMAQVMEGGIDSALNIVLRKIDMNLSLIRYTIWSRVFLASLATMAVLFFRPRGIMERIRAVYPFLYCGMVGLVAGSIAALVFNDSGVVAAATAMISGVPLLIFMVLEEWEEDRRPGSNMSNI